MYTKRLPFSISVILWVEGLRIFSYLISEVSSAPSFSSVLVIQESSTVRGIPLMVTLTTSLLGFSVPAEKGFVSNTDTLLSYVL